jgi:endonuclease/exonuclease/phosphatase family metal-dependent hydrolase
LETALKEVEFKPIYIMGDFNNPADIRNEGYDLITNAGWQDAYAVAATRIGSVTVPPANDSWERNEVPLSIDYILSDQHKRSKHTRSSSMETNYLASPIIMGLPSRIPDQYVLIFVKL